MAWVVVATAPDQLTAEMWRGLLLSADVPARVDPGDVASFLGVRTYPCRLMVPEEHMADALMVLSSNLETGDAGSQEPSGPEAG